MSSSSSSSNSSGGTPARPRQRNCCFPLTPSLRMCTQAAPRRPSMLSVVGKDHLKEHSSASATPSERPLRCLARPSTRAHAWCADPSVVLPLPPPQSPVAALPCTASGRQRRAAALVH
jgi:hypothetical protein